jgi:cystathionine beta-lyase
MKFDFTTVIDRAGKDALALDMIPIKDAEIKPGFSRIPMWIADMNFATAPSVTRAIMERTQHPCFGYFAMPDAYYDAIIRWQTERNGATGLTRDCIGYENGVLGGVASVVQAFSSPGDAVLLHAPTYVGFTHTLENCGRKIVLSNLKRDENGVWRMDYEDMDRKLKESRIHVAIFCTPHNPTGRVWERWEVERAMEVYRANDCVVICDEIWSDIILGDHKHIAPQTVSEDAKNRTVSLYATSKTFNLAGLVGSYHIIYNPTLRDRVLRQAALSHYNDANILSVHALIGAYTDEGSQWVDELRQVLTQNVDYACDFIASHFDGVKLAKPEGTYMLYLDCSEWCQAHGVSIDELQKRGVACGVIWQDGRPFNCDNTIRMNLALPQSMLKEAFDRLAQYVFCN